MGFSAVAAFGITAASAGATAATVAGIAATAVIGAGVGAATAAITGGDIGKGALFGGITGGITGGLGAAVGGAGGFAGAAGGAGSDVGAAGAGAIGGIDAATPAFTGIGDAVTGDLATTGAGGFADGASALAAADPTLSAADLAELNSSNPAAYDASQASISNVVNGGQQASPSWLQRTVGALTGAPSNSNTQAGAAAKSAGGFNGTTAALGALASLGTNLLAPKPAAPNYSVTPGPGSTAATQGPLWNSPLPGSTSSINRTPLLPTNLPGANVTPGKSPSYFNYGTLSSEPIFFGNNQLQMSHGGDVQHGALSQGRDYGAGEIFDTRNNDHYVEGDSGGQDDDVNAKLSTGEWVADANFVSALGDGNNAAGAKVLYDVRRAVMHDKGMKHEVPPKLKKGALSYFAEAKKKRAS